MKYSLYRRLIYLVTASALTITQAGQPFNIKGLASQTKDSTDSKKLETFLDPIFDQRMAKLHVPGAVIAIVKDGKIIFTKGYGVADIEKNTPVMAQWLISNLMTPTSDLKARVIWKRTKGKR